MAQAPASSAVSSDEKAKDVNDTAKVQPLTYETIYAGSIHLLNVDPSRGNPHQCILFISTSKDELIAPKTVSRVSYQMHPTEDKKDGYYKEFRESPFFGH